MKKISTIFILAFFAVTSVVNATLPKEIAISSRQQEERKVSNFNGIEVGGALKVYVKLGNTESLRLEGDSEAIAELITEVKDGILTIKPKKSQWKEWFKKFNNTKIVAYVTAKQINSLGLSGSGSIIAESPINTNKEFSAAISGSGSIKATVNAQSLSAAISGSGGLKIDGKAQSAQVAVSGSGSFQGREFSIDKLDAHVSGSGSVHANVNKSINAAISGSGGVTYTGNPATINKAVSGSGRVRKAD